MLPRRQRGKLDIKANEGFAFVPSPRARSHAEQRCTRPRNSTVTNAKAS
jgi:hypothetical protein